MFFPSCESSIGIAKPAKSGATPIRVDCIYVPIIGNIDITSNTFDIKVDVDLTWPASEQDLQNYSSHPSTYTPSFVPNLVFINSMSVDTDVLVPLQGNHFYQIREGNRNYIRHRFIGKMVNNYRVENFPFDVQNLVLAISLSFYDMDQAYFEAPDKSYLYVPRRFTALPGWELNRCFSGIIDNGNFSTIIAVVQAKRIRAPYFFRIFSPLFVLNLATFSIYFVGDAIEEKINILITSLLSFVGMIYVLSSLVPMAGQTTLFDKYSMTSIAMCVLGIFGNGWYHLYGDWLSLDIMFYAHLCIMVLYHLYFGMMMITCINAANRKLKHQTIQEVTEFYSFDPLTYPNPKEDKFD